MSYTTNPGSGGVTFRSRTDGSDQVPGVESDARQLSRLIDVASSAVTYVCEAAPGSATSAAAWRIKRLSVSGTVTSIGFAGTGVFDQVADNRAALTYS